MVDDFSEDNDNSEIEDIIDGDNNNLNTPFDNNNFSESSTQSYGSRIAESFMGIIFGLLLFIAAFPLLWWNEGNSLRQIKTLDEGKNLVIAIAPNRLDPVNEGKLVYITGKASSDEVLNDDIFGVHENALKMNRFVDMYQWKESQTTETHKNIGGSETKQVSYSYSKEWSSNLINSSSFRHPEGHSNPTSISYPGQSFVASSIKIGAFRLSSEFVDKIDSFNPYQLSEQNFSIMNATLKPFFKLNGGQYFYGDPSDTQIGSLRVSYNIIRPGDFSVVGKQVDGVIQPYYNKNGNIVLLSGGIVGADSLFAKEENKNSIMTWLIRLGGFLLMWIGINTILKPISVLADVLPFLGSIAGAGIGLVTGIVSFILSLATIATAWLFCRPLIAVGIFVVAILFFAGGINMIKNAEKRIKYKLKGKVTTE
ncbi:MAG: TMEM43 family protein [Pseudomonadota bacterium]